MTGRASRMPIAAGTLAQVQFQEVLLEDELQVPAFHPAVKVIMPTVDSLGIDEDPLPLKSCSDRWCSTCTSSCNAISVSCHCIMSAVALGKHCSRRHHIDE